MRPEVKSNQFEIPNQFEKSFRLCGSFTMTNFESSNPFQNLFRLYDDFTAETFPTIARF